MAERNREIAEKIISAYEENIDRLPPYILGHFFTRAFKVTGDEKYRGVLEKFMLAYCPVILEEALEKMRSRTFSYTYSAKQNGARAEERFAFYRRQPQTKFYLDLLQYFIYLEKFNLTASFLGARKEEFLRRLKQEDFAGMFLTEEAVRTNGSFVFNCLYVLKDLGVIGLTEAGEKFICKMYAAVLSGREKMETLSDADFVSLSYTLTHMIIAASRYYEQRVDRYEWAVKFFADQAGPLSRRAPLDVLAETALCFRLSGKEEEYREAYRILIDRIGELFAPEQDLAPENLVRREHTNSLLLLLLAEGESFHPGPDLSGGGSRK